jgi:large subunit ribosomal protein L17
MRHRKKINHLSRTNAHRKAMLGNMASSLIINKRITTTTAKAKALRIFVEPLITRSKDDSTHSRRMVFKHLRDKYAVSELFREVAEKVGDRPGGYTRIIKIGNRLGDNADMSIIELVDFNENLLAEKAAAKPKTRRRRRGGTKNEEEGQDLAATTEMEAEEAPVAEEVEVVPEEALAEEPEAVAEEAPVAEEVEVVPEEALSEEPKAEAEEASATEEPEVIVEEIVVDAKSEDISEEKKDEDGSPGKDEEENEENIKE